MQLIKHTIFDNKIDNFIPIFPSKHQFVFFPKEEHQMFSGLSYNNIATSTPVSSSPTDYIGVGTANVPVVINSNSIDVFCISNHSSITGLYTEGSEKIRLVSNRFQFLRIPSNIFNIELTTEEEILENNGAITKWNYGQYVIYIEPKAVLASVINIINPIHNNIGNRRTVIEVNKANLGGTYWNFENSPAQSGRLYGSMVEIWNNTQTVLKQTKFITENKFNFGASDNTQLVLSPDIVGYDVNTQAVSSGDILKIFPRETYFENICIVLDFKDEKYEASSYISYATNDVVRDITTGIFEIYDKNGMKIDDNGVFNGNVVAKYQISQHDNYEIRRRLK